MKKLVFILIVLLSFSVAGSTIHVNPIINTSIDNESSFLLAESLCLVPNLEVELIKIINAQTGITCDLSNSGLSAETGFSTGLYNDWLKFESNDTLHLFDSIQNQMLVYLPATIFGYINNCNTGLPMEGVSVSTYGTYSGAGTSVQTDEFGYYEMDVDEDTYDVFFSLLGYMEIIVVDSFATAGMMNEISICMVETPYPVSWVMAQPNQDDTECLITWGLPMGIYEIIYDDGEPDDFVIWTTPGNAVAVRFTPAGYPAKVLGGRFNVGDGSFPGGTYYLGTQMGIGVMDDDGIGGMPGTILDSAIVDIVNYGWIDVNGIFDDTISDGDFYIVLWQLGDASSSAPVAVDTDMPTVYRSYVKLDGDPWSTSPYQDFMIRAYIYGPNAGVFCNNSIERQVQLPKVSEGPFLATSLPENTSGTVKNGEFRYLNTPESNRDLIDYSVAVVSDFDPNLGPQTGTLTPIANTTETQYNDILFDGYFEGFYAYAIKANYDSNDSEWTFSNTVSHLLDNEVIIVVYSCNDSIEDMEVAIFGTNYPYHSFMEITDSNGVVVFDSVIDGHYDLFILGVGYHLDEHFDININSDTTIGYEVTQKMYSPTNLKVEPDNSVATWNEPLITQLYLEEFEEPIFPPSGWQSTTLGVGWYRSDDAGTDDWVIPTGDGFYAVSNDNAAGSISDGSMDYLITPELDLRESSDFELIFSHFYDAAHGQSAYVEYSYDNGATWEVLESMSPVSDWTSVSVDMSMLSGADSEPVKLAFHSDDKGIHSSGWALDNVEVKNGPAPVLAYYVFLNDEFYTQTNYDQTSCFFTDLNYGEFYESCVVAVYDCGSSDPVCTTWESIFLHPPHNLMNEYIYNTDEVPLKWNPPIKDSEVPDGLLSFNVYRDSVNIAEVSYDGQNVDDWITYIDNELDVDTYNYWVSANYDLAVFGYPGDTAESAWIGPDEVNVIWGFIIPFYEGWDIGSFTFQNWSFNENAANWVINSQQGGPEPSVEFTWDPLLQDGYSATISSNPIIVDYLTEGDLYLSYDLRLEDRNSTGDEKMLIEIHDGQTWYTVAEHSNDSEYSFVTNIVNISNYASGNTIKIRFNAIGKNSFDIISWFIDNIFVYRECTAPEDLTGEPKWDPILPYFQICWNAENNPTNTALSNGNNELYGDFTIDDEFALSEDSVNNPSRNISVFNIYRMAEDETEYELYDVVEYIEGETYYCYNDVYTNLISYGYYYKVTALYESDTDICESSPAKAYEIPSDDFVYVHFIGIAENSSQQLKVFPNPSHENINVNSILPIRQISITNQFGLEVFSAQYYNKTNVIVNTSNYENGLYIISIDTDKGTATQKVVIF
jgi:type IX secretion system substrate protein/reelin-like protein